MDRKLTFCVDIDGTLCTPIKNQEYYKAEPYDGMIDRVNKLYDDGHIIKLFTARGMGSGKNFEDITKKQMKKWGVKHHSLQFGKPSADFYLDDKSLGLEEFVTLCEVNHFDV